MIYDHHYGVWTCLKMRCAIKLKCLEGKMLMNQLICSNKLKDHIKISWGHTHLIAKWKSWWFISPIGNIMVNPIIATPVWAYELAIPGIGSFKMTPVAVWWPRCPRICHMKVATIQTVKRCDGSKPTRQSVGLIYIYIMGDETWILAFQYIIYIYACPSP